jgi:hypothetical protein
MMLAIGTPPSCASLTSSDDAEEDCTAGVSLDAVMGRARARYVRQASSEFFTEYSFVVVVVIEFAQYFMSGSVNAASRLAGRSFSSRGMSVDPT